MEQIIITEGKFDRILLEKILPERIKEKSKLVEGMGSTSALSLARSYSAKGNNKILVIIDSDTFDENQITERKEYAESVTKMVSTNSEIKIIMFIPEMDVLFFSDQNFIESYFNKKMSNFEFNLYKRDPKFAFVTLSHGQSVNKVRQSLLSELSPTLVNEMRKDQQVIDIIDFLK